MKIGRSIDNLIVLNVIQISSSIAIIKYVTLTLLIPLIILYGITFILTLILILDILNNNKEKEANPKGKTK